MIIAAHDSPLRSHRSDGHDSACGQERKPPTPETPEIPSPPLVLPTVPQRSVSSDAELAPEIKARIEAFFMMLGPPVSDGYKKLFEGAALAQERPELIKELAVTTTTVLEKCGRLESTEMLRVRARADHCAKSSTS